MALTFLMLAACGPHLVWHGRSVDRIHEVRIVDDHGQHVVIDGVAGPTFDAVPIGTLAIDGAHVAYAARRAGRWHVIVDGREGPAFDAIGELVYRADGVGAVYAAELGRQWRVIIGDREGPTFASLLAGTLTVSSDGRRVAYAGARDDGAHVVVDGEISSGWTGVGQLAFSADSRHVAYVARSGDVAVAVRDGASGRGYDAIGQLVLGPADRFAYLAQRATGWVAVVDGVEGTSWDLVLGLAFSSDGAHVAYAARRAQGDATVVVDGLPGASYRGVRPAGLAFPPGAARPTFVARRGDRFLVVHDGVDGPPFDDVHPPVFSADGTRWAYVARFGDVWIPVIDGMLARSERWASDPVWSRDGSRLAYLARRGPDTAVILDGVEHRFDLVLDGTLVFDPSGRHWGCIAGDRKQRRFYFVIDGMRQGQLEIGEAIDSAMRNEVLGNAERANEHALHDWVAAEVVRSAR